LFVTIGSLMPEVHRVFMVNLAEATVTVEYFLIKPHSRLVEIDFLDVASEPTGAPTHFEPVPPTAVGKIVPSSELPLILRTFMRIHSVD